MYITYIMSHIDYPNNNNPNNSPAPNYSSQSAFVPGLAKGDRGYYGNDNGGAYSNSNSAIALFAAVQNLTAGDHSPPGSKLNEWLDVTNSDTWADIGIAPPANWREVTPTYTHTTNYPPATLVQYVESRGKTGWFDRDENGNLVTRLLKNKPANSNLKI